MKVNSSPWHEDTDEDGMPDGWEATNGLDPRDGSNGDMTQIEMVTTQMATVQSHLAH